MDREDKFRTGDISESSPEKKGTILSRGQVFEDAVFQEVSGNLSTTVKVPGSQDYFKAVPIGGWQPKTGAKIKIELVSNIQQVNIKSNFKGTWSCRPAKKDQPSKPQQTKDPLIGDDLENALALLDNKKKQERDNALKLRKALEDQSRRLEEIKRQGKK